MGNAAVLEKIVFFIRIVRRAKDNRRINSLAPQLFEIRIETVDFGGFDHIESVANGKGSDCVKYSLEAFSNELWL
jgi:hypothetical protein